MSPLERLLIIFKTFFFTLICGYSFLRIFLSKRYISSSVCWLNINTLVLESNALITVKEGFSVVAPISMMTPFSTYGRSASCCALFHLCISSKKRIVFLPYCWLLSAILIIFLSASLPAVTACSLWKS